MFPDLEPLSLAFFFGLGFVPVVVVGAVVSIFLPVPLWAVVVTAAVAGFGVSTWMAHHN